MANLFLLADDFTGALDSSAAFASYNVITRVVIANQLREEDFQADILVVDSETRHMPLEQAYQVVWDLVRQAKKHCVPIIYKKTDSALRGNVGGELSAALEASGERRLHFIPAFPQLGRTTVGGIQYVEGVPVAESIFGQDPFEPVKTSSVSKLLSRQISRSALNVSVISCGERAAQNAQGILIYDAEKEEDLYNIGMRIAQQGDLKVLAGCAGMTSVLPALLNLPQKKIHPVQATQKMLVICGSINPISAAQCVCAQLSGAARFCLPAAAKELDSWLGSGEADELVEQVARACFKHEITILDTNDQETEDRNHAFAAITPASAQLRTKVMDTIGSLTQRLLEREPDCTLMIIGGDTLFGVMKQLGISHLSPQMEVLPGIVLSTFRYRQRYWNIVSKSGGFGGNEVIFEAYHALGRGKEKAI